MAHRQEPIVSGRLSEQGMDQMRPDSWDTGNGVKCRARNLLGPESRLLLGISISFARTVLNSYIQFCLSCLPLPFLLYVSERSGCTTCRKETCW